MSENQLKLPRSNSVDKFLHCDPVSPRFVFTGFAHIEQFEQALHRRFRSK